MATPYRIAAGTTAATLLPIFEAVGEHDLVGPAFNAKLQLANGTKSIGPPRRGNPPAASRIPGPHTDAT